jgi:ribosomal protein uL23
MEKVILYPLATEKSIRQMESQNKLSFAVNINSTKDQIKQAIEKEFNAKVLNVKTAITSRGIKKAYIKFSDETPAIDIATKLGLM